MIDVFKAFLVGIFAFERGSFCRRFLSDYFLSGNFFDAFLVVGFLAIMTEFFRVYI